jgi:hypothetical protein
MSMTALSADGSRLAVEIFMHSPDTVAALNTAYQKWYEHGLDVQLDNLGYPGGAQRRRSLPG